MDSINSELDNYLDTYKNKWSTNEYIKNWKIISQTNISQNGYKGYQLITESSTNVYSTVIEYQTKVYLIQQENRIINVTATASKIDFNNHKKTFDNLFLSLHLD